MTPANAPAEMWWERRGFAAAMIALSVLPMLYPAFPPLVDLPSHMGRYQIALGDSDLLARYYHFRWQLSGNLGADLLIVPLAHLVGAAAATKFVAILIPPFTVAALFAIARRTHGRLGPTAAMAVPLTYSQPYLYGFLNFTLGTAMAYWALWLFLRLSNGSAWIRALAMAPAAALVFVTHAAGWGILGLSAFAVEIVAQRRANRSWVQSAVRAGVQMIPLALPLALLLVWQSTATGDTLIWFDFTRKMIWSGLLFRDYWTGFDIFSFCLLVGLALAILLWPKVSTDKGLRWASFGLFASFVVMPFVVFGSALADVRLLPAAFSLLFVSVMPTKPGRQDAASLLALLSVLFALMRIGSSTLSFALAGERQQEQMTVLERLPRGARVAVAVQRPCGLRTLGRSDHLGSIAIVKREAFTNDQWYLPGSVSLVVDYPAAGKYAADPSQFLNNDPCDDKRLARWMAALPADAFDYVWLLDTDPMPTAFVGQWEPVAHAEGSRLYRKVQAGRVSTQP